MAGHTASPHWVTFSLAFEAWWARGLLREPGGHLAAPGIPGLHLPTGRSSLEMVCWASLGLAGRESLARLRELWGAGEASTRGGRGLVEKHIVFHS